MSKSERDALERDILADPLALEPSETLLVSHGPSVHFYGDAATVLLFAYDRASALRALAIVTRVVEDCDRSVVGETGQP